MNRKHELDGLDRAPASQVVFSIPTDLDLLRKAFDVIFAAHVNEESTIRVADVWGCRSKLLDGKGNPKRYWNRPDAQSLHGEPVS